jgi:hypothetical protein
VEPRTADPGSAALQPNVQGRPELLDHILVSRALGVERVESVDTGAGEPPSITGDVPPGRDEPVSDHLRVVARFQLD